MIGSKKRNRHFFAFILSAALSISLNTVTSYAEETEADNNSLKESTVEETEAIEESTVEETEAIEESTVEETEAIEEISIVENPSEDILSADGLYAESFPADVTYTIDAPNVVTATNIYSEVDPHQCTIYGGYTINAQNCVRYGKVLNSYLFKSVSGFISFRYSSEDEKYIVQNFTNDMSFAGEVIIPNELPIFGGFYYDGTYAYILTGQNNLSDNPNLEVYRLTKYDANWNKVGTLSLYGEDTYKPFAFGSARMTMKDNILYIRTCREMFDHDGSGVHHQAASQINVDVTTMTVKSKLLSVSYSKWGYVSHSLNQFVRIDGDYLVALDLGDAYPREVLLHRTSIGNTSTSDEAGLISLGGATGDNSTGVSLGGLEVSPATYIVAGNTIDQSKFSTSTADTATRNVFISIMGKGFNSTDLMTKMLTDYPEGDVGASTPQLVDIGNNYYLVLWKHGGDLVYCKIDYSGNVVGNAYSFDGELSDCAPIVSGDKVYWYTWDRDVQTFYTISTTDLSRTTTAKYTFGHKFSYSNVSGGAVTRTCSECKLSERKTVLTSFWVYYSTAEYGTYMGGSSYTTACNQPLYYWATSFSPSDAQINNIIITSSNENVAYAVPNSNNKLNPGKYVYGNEEGTAVITFTAEGNPTLCKKFSLTVKHNYSKTGETPATTTSPAIDTYTCADCHAVREVFVGEPLPEPEKTVNFMGIGGIIDKDLGISFWFTDLPSDGSIVIQNGSTTKKVAVSSLSPNTRGEYSVLCDVPIVKIRESGSIYVENSKGERVNMQNGSNTATVFGWSAYIYLNAISSNAGYPEKERNIAKALIDLGDNASAYLGYNYAGTIVVSHADNRALSSFEKIISTSGNVDGLDYVGSTLSFDESINIRHYFAGNISGCTFSIGGGLVTPKPACDNMYYIELKDVYAANLGANTQIEVTKSSGTWTMNYSALSYCYDASQNGDSKLKNLGISIYEYYAATQ